MGKSINGEKAEKFFENNYNNILNSYYKNTEEYIIEDKRNYSEIDSFWC